MRTSHHYPLRLPHSLQNSETHCKPSQHTVQHIANHGNTLTATHCNTLQYRMERKRLLERAITVLRGYLTVLGVPT